MIGFRAYNTELGHQLRVVADLLLQSLPWPIIRTNRSKHENDEVCSSMEGATVLRELLFCFARGAGSGSGHLGVSGGEWWGH